MFTRLTASGECRVEEIPEARILFQRLFLQGIEMGNLKTAIVTRTLLELTHSSLREGKNAELCLRCYISNQIRSSCDRLAAKFGERHGFRGKDLLSFVLDNERLGSKPPCFGGTPTDYQSMADRILETFNPDLGRLNAWVDLLVKQDNDLDRFLLEHSVYLVTDWAILNETTLSKLQEVPSKFYNRTMGVEQACLLLRAYHAVYRQDRLDDRIRGNGQGKCKQPTPDQLRRMAQFVRHRDGMFPLETDGVLRRLKDIAADLREYRICQRTGTVPTDSLDGEGVSPIADDRSSNTNVEEAEFLRHYRETLLDCLDEAIAQIIEVRVRKFQKYKRKTNPQEGQRKAQNFLEAMQLHQCQGLSMEEIALKLGLKKQYKVSRLLKLKEFRADVRHQTLAMLRDRLKELLPPYIDPHRLQCLDLCLDEMLGEQIDEMLQPTDSIFTHRICRYLDLR